MKDVLKQAVTRNYAFWICLIVAILMLVTSFLIPPTGFIEPSVLEAVAELWAFGALGAFITALSKGLDARVKHGDTAIEVGDFNKEEDDYERGRQEDI